MLRAIISCLFFCSIFSFGQDWTPEAGVYYKMVFRHSDKCIRPAGGSMGNVLAEQYTCDETDESIYWRFEPTQSDFYQAINKKTGMSFDIYSTGTPTKVGLWTPKPSSEWRENQEIRFSAYGAQSGYYFIFDNWKNQTLDVEGNSTANGAQIISYPQKSSGTANQEVKFVPESNSTPPTNPIPGVYYQVRYEHSDKCIAVANGDLINGANIEQQSCNTGEHQQLKLNTEADGYFSLQFLHSDLMVDIEGATTDNGGNVLQWSYHGNDNQLFQLIDHGNNTYSFQFKHSSKCVDVSGASTSDGANVLQWDCHYNDNQRFTFNTSVNPAPPRVTKLSAGPGNSYFTRESNSTGINVSMGCGSNINNEMFGSAYGTVNDLFYTPEFVGNPGMSCTSCHDKSQHVVDIKSQGGTTLILWETGRVYGVGENDQIHRLAPPSVPEPDPVEAHTGIALENSEGKAIEIGEIGSYIIKSDNTLWSRGKNSWNVLGLGPIGLFADELSQVRTSSTEYLTDVKSVSSSRHTLIVTMNGTLYACGDNTAGQLGLGYTNFEPDYPTIVPSFSGNVDKAVAGTNYTFILKTDMSLWACGSNSGGSLGINSTVSQSTPVKVMDNVADVACGNGHTLILTTSGALYACGANQYGQLGDGTTSNRLAPVQIRSQDVVSIAVGYSHSLFSLADETVWSCGSNFNGELGYETSLSYPNATPQQITFPYWF